MDTPAFIDRLLDVIETEIAPKTRQGVNSWQQAVRCRHPPEI